MTKAAALIRNCAIGVGAVALIGWAFRAGKKKPACYMGTTVEDMLDSYQEYIRLARPDNLNRFRRTRERDREAAVAEAIVYGMLQHLNADPRINDDTSRGGADFLCCASRGPLLGRVPADQFVVEATSLNPEKVTERSGIRNEVPDGITGGAFSLVTQNIWRKVSGKENQLAKYDMPRVLAIVSGHFASAVLFNNYTATIALVSGLHWRHKINSAEVDRTNYTDLRTSIFFKPGPDGTIIATRKGISAVLLIAVHGDKSEAWGILHPEPERPLNIDFLPDVPFVRVAEWPIVAGKISTEWVIAHPSGYEVRHFPIKLPG
jgi:hypothetical protein